jgi:biotin synthase-like enzyme
MKKTLLNQQQLAELEEILEMAKITEQKAREMCEMSTAIAWKYQKRIHEIEQP